MKNEIEFTLTCPIKYENGGEQVKGEKLILIAPTNKQRQARNNLVDYINKAQNDAQEKIAKMMASLDSNTGELAEAMSQIAAESETKTKEEPKEKTEEELDEIGMEILGQIFSCESIKTNAFVEEFLLLLQEVCKVEGEKKLTKPLFEKMHCDDTDRLLGRYIGNFLNGSS